MSLYHRFASVLEARGPDDLLKSLVGFTKRLGFDSVTAIAVLDRPCGQSKFFVVDNAPEELVAVHGDGRDDPVMQHCKYSCMPIVWDQQTYVTAGKAHIWETLARFGYRTGIGVATHLPSGRHFCIGVDRDQALPACADEIARLAAELQLLAAHAQDSVLRIMLPTGPDRGLPELTPRELETLRWTMEGKTAWEVGRILSISEQTAVRHLNNATHKLGCVNKHQAVVKALRLGVIT
jgi:DNA-binding CsgD family transcriptional regulator